MKEGATARDTYQHALAFVRDKKPELEKNFVKTIGHGVSADSPSTLPSNLTMLPRWG